MATKIRNVPVRDVECDELWAFIGKKQKRVRPEDDPNLGDAYTFVAIERHSKLVLNIAMGKRDKATTDIFIEGLRQANKFQITSDGFQPYVKAISDTLEDRCDFAQLIKVYKSRERRRRPLQPCRSRFCGGGPSHGSTRTRTNLYFDCRAPESQRPYGHAPLYPAHECVFQKVENHWAAVAVRFAFYNFVRVHKSLRMTPAMAAGIADHIWTVRELLEVA